MNKTSENKNIGYLYIIATAILWSTGGLLIKLVDAHPIFIACGRSFVVAVVFLPWIKFKQIKFSKELVILAISYTICLTTFVLSTRLTTAANAIAIQYSSPLFLFLGIVLFKKQYDKTKLLPMIVIFLGIAAFLLEPSYGSNVYGNILALISGVTFAVLIYYLGFNYNISSIGLIGLLNLILFPVVAIFIPWKSSPWPTDSISIIALVFLGVIQIGLAYILFYKGRRTIDALNASIICLIEPILNPFIVFLFIGEVPTVYAFIGAGFIILGQILNIFSEKRKSKNQLLM
jgi:drug/metabolite transporter (DMT)-like permease